MKIIITGGHLTPSLAVIEELKNSRAISPEPLDILFIGRKYPLEGEHTVSSEYKIISRMGIPFVSLTTGRLQRRFTNHTISSLLKIPIGFLQALWWVGKFNPDIILSFGGYIAVPVVLAGWLWRIPVVTHEQTVSPGLSNKIIGFFSKKICVSWPDSMSRFPKDKAVLTGNPVRKEIFKVNKKSQYIISHKPLTVIYITGGSLGSHSINEMATKCLPQLLEKYIVIHQCGDSQKFRDFEKLSDLRASLTENLKNRYFLTKYVDADDIGAVLSSADLVVGRSGANTVTELTALGKPAIFIPLPWAGANEQFQNAHLLADLGAAVILSQEGLFPEALLGQIDAVVNNIGHYKKNAEKAKKIVDSAARSKIAAVVEGLYAPKREN